MHENITTLETLEGLAAVLQDGSRKRVQQELRVAAKLFDPRCSEEELAALAILARETRRGNEVVDVRHLRACTKQEYRMSVRWDVVLGTLAERELVAVLTDDGDTGASGSQLRSLLRERSGAELRVGLRLCDPAFDPARTDMGYASNRQYLQDCFEFLALFSDMLDTHRGKPARKRRENAESDESLEERYALLRRRAAQSDPLPPLEQLTRQLELSRLEWSIVLLMLFSEIEGDAVEVRNLIGLTGDDILERYELRQYFENNGTLIASGIIELHGDYPTPQLDVTLNSEISRWLLSGGETPEIAGGGTDEPAPFTSNEDYVTGWINVVRALIGESDGQIPHFRKRRRKSSSVPAVEHPAFTAFAHRVRCTEACYPLEQMGRDAGLDTNERILLAIGMYMALRDGSFGISNATAVLAGSNLFDRLRMKRYFEADSPLLREGLLEIDDGFMGSRDCTMPPDVLQRVIADESVVGDNASGNTDMTFFEQRSPGHTLSDAVLPPSVMDNLGVALGSLQGELRSCLQSWGVERITAGREQGSLLLLFSGPPGTGKTFTAEAFAGALGRDMLVTDAANILSKWYGESEQNLRSMFSSYARLAKTRSELPVLLFNECDQLMMRRSAEDSGKSTQQTEHRLQNILLDQIERFPGILIATTNLVSSLDEAFSRRFDYKIVFPAPDAEARTALWRRHIPSTVPLDADVDFTILAARYAFTGGQIAVAAANALRSAAKRGDRLTQADLQNACLFEERGSFDQTSSERVPVGFQLSGHGRDLKHDMETPDKEQS